MLDGKTRERLAGLIVAAFEQQPLGVRVKAKDLLESISDLEKQSDGTFKIVGTNTVLDEDDLRGIVFDALIHLKEDGYFIDGFYSDEYRLFERLSPGSKLDLSGLKEMEYKETDAWGISVHRGFSLKGRELSEAANPMSEKPVKSVRLTDEQFARLCKIVESANVSKWKADYQPEGYLVLDGAHWGFTMIFEGNKAFVSHGSNAWPNGFEMFYRNIMGMLKKGRRRD